MCRAGAEFHWCRYGGAEGDFIGDCTGSEEVVQLCRVRVAEVQSAEVVQMCRCRGAVVQWFSEWCSGGAVVLRCSGAEMQI
jgi:hypothetical protein